jgi:hypothetical protein
MAGTDCSALHKLALCKDFRDSSQPNAMRTKRLSLKGWTFARCAAVVFPPRGNLEDLFGLI